MPKSAIIEHPFDGENARAIKRVRLEAAKASIAPVVERDLKTQTQPKCSVAQTSVISPSAPSKTGSAKQLPIPSQQHRQHHQQTEQRNQKQHRHHEDSIANLVQNDQISIATSSNNAAAQCTSSASTASLPTSLSKMQQAMSDKLSGARFRMLNEKLYTQDGASSFKDMSGDPALFDAYHAGYRVQAKQWPQNPLDEFISMVQANPSWVVADLGCGDARLRKSVKNEIVHSYDLVSRDPCVTAANLADLPLPSNTCDCVVICLALMGSDYHQFLLEASRILKVGGRLLLAEVSSRIENVNDFTGILQFIGFKVDVKKQVGGSFFFVCHATKSRDLHVARAEVVKRAPKLRACEYKRR